MADHKELTRIYRIEAPGLDQITTKIQQLNAEIKLQQGIKREANKIKLTNADDPAVIEKVTKALAASEIAIKKLTAEKRIAQKEGDALLKQEEKLATAHIREGQAAKAAATSVAEASEHYRQLVKIARESPQSGFINWKGEVLSLEQAKTKLLEYRKVVDDFNRSLSPDGTLVGEYKTGILNAFKDLGLTDLIKDQKFKIQQEISDLIVKNQQLVKNYKDVGKAGPEAFRAIEPTLERNIKRQQELEAKLKDINTVLTTQGNIGTQVTSAIGKGFKDIITAGLGVAGITLGFQQVFSFLNSANEEFKQAELNSLRLNNALRNLGKEQYFDDLIVDANRLAEEIGYLDNDDIIRAQEKLVTYGKLTKAQIKELLPTIIDLAANLGVELPEATSIVIKALEGQGRSLKEMGIKLKEGKTLGENFNIVQTQLKDRVEGSAETLRNSFAGAAKTAEQNIKDLQEEIGAKSGPAWMKFKEAIFQGINGLLSLDETLKNLTERSPIFRKLFFFTNDVQQFNKDQAFKNTPLGQYQEQLKITTSTLPSLLAELNSKTAKEQQVFVEQQDAFVQGARQDYLALKNSSDASETEVKKAAARLDGYKKITSELKKQLIENKNDVAAYGEDVDPEKAKEAAEKAARERERIRKEAQERRLRQIDREETEAQILLERRRNEGKVLENEYEATMFDIKNNAQNARIGVLEKGLQEEKDQAAKIRLEIIKNEQEYNNKIFEIIKKRIDSEKQERIIAAKDVASLVTDDPLASPAQKAQAQLSLNEEILRIERDTNAKLLNAEEVFNKKSADLQRARGEQEKELQRNINNSVLEVAKEGIAERLAAIDEAELHAITQRVEKLKAKIEEILGSGKSPAKKIDLLDRAKDVASLDTRDIEIAADKQKLEIFKKQLEQRQISQIDFDRFQEALLNKQIQREEKAAQLSIDKEKKKQEVRTAIIQSAEQILDDFLQGMFQGQEERINKEKEAAFKRLDLEKEQVLAQAQSADERASIEKQFAAKRKEIEKQEGERMKQQKLKELAILTAVGIGQALASTPWPLNLIAAASVAIQGLIQKGVINAQTFANSGLVQKAYPYSRLKGLINVSPNVAPLPNGDNVLAYVKPGEVVLNQQHQRLLGGARTFRAIGVPGFALGGRVPGDSLQPPSNPSSFLKDTGGSSLQGVGELLAATQEMVVATNRRIDKISVVLDPRAALTATNKVVQNDKIGAL